MIASVFRQLELVSRKGIDNETWIIVALAIALLFGGAIMVLAGDLMEALMSGGQVLSVLSDLTGGVAG